MGTLIGGRRHDNGDTAMEAIHGMGSMAGEADKQPTKPASKAAMISSSICHLERWPIGPGRAANPDQPTLSFYSRRTRPARPETGFNQRPNPQTDRRSRRTALRQLHFTEMPRPALITLALLTLTLNAQKPEPDWQTAAGTKNAIRSSQHQTPTAFKPPNFPLNPGDGKPSGAACQRYFP